MSITLAFGMAVALVEKGNNFPIRPWRIRLQILLRKIVGRKFSRVVKCTVCASFWFSLISDIVLGIICLLKTGTLFFFWPFSGFIAMGLTFIIIEYLNAIDKEANINVIVENKKGENDYEEQY